jgi:hypothetical protein
MSKSGEKSLVHTACACIWNWKNPVKKSACCSTENMKKKGTRVQQQCAVSRVCGYSTVCMNTVCEHHVRCGEGQVSAWRGKNEHTNFTTYLSQLIEFLMGLDFCLGEVLDLLWREDAELNAFDLAQLACFA